MKKLIIGIVVFVAVVFMLAYGILFTQPGNNLLRPTVESKINSALKTKMTLEKFTLRPSYLFVKLKTPMGSSFVFGGKFGLFSKEIDAKYNLSVVRGENKFKLKGFELKGPFYVKGTVKGSMEGILSIDGKSNFASSDISYGIKVKNKKPEFFSINIDKLKLKTLLGVLNKPAFADAFVKANIKLTSFKENALKGRGEIYITNGAIDRKVMKKAFNINLPKTVFNANAVVVLNGSLANFGLNFNSNLGKSFIKGSYIEKTNGVKAKYDINLSNLALLTPITNMELKGSFATNGTIKGTKSLISIKGQSAVADSHTTYAITIKNSNINSINLLIKNAKLNKLLALFNKPVYAYGIVNAKIKTDGVNPKNLNGTIEANISKGVVNSAAVKKLFNLNMPKTTFTANVLSNIKNSVAVSKVAIKSSIASLNTKKTVFNIPNFKLNSDYTLIVPDLNKLYFATNRHMKGSTTLTGSIDYSQKGLTATGLSKMWGGSINFRLANNNLVGSAKNISVVKVTDMMMYNRIFDSKGSVNLNYNLLTKKGVFKALFVNGHILPNRITFLLHNMARFDITREIYKTTSIYSTIDNKKIFSDLDMISRLTHITSKHAFIDLNRDLIDAKIRVAIKKSAVYVKLKGNLNHPRIKIDFKNLLKHKVEKKLKNLLKGFIK